nr:hypothetical protein [Burkholderia anthina]
MKALTLMCVKRHLLAHLRDPALSPAAVEQAMGISSRYINTLFEAENTSLMRYVWNLRLERCAGDSTTCRISVARFVNGLRCRRAHGATCGARVTDCTGEGWRSFGVSGLMWWKATSRARPPRIPTSSRRG